MNRELQPFMRSKVFSPEARSVYQAFQCLFSLPFSLNKSISKKDRFPGVVKHDDIEAWTRVCVRIHQSAIHSELDSFKELFVSSLFFRRLFRCLLFCSIQLL